MTGIWTNTGDGWELGSPRGFPDEATLHGLIENNPQLLPLAGEPRLIFLGSEVQLGTGYADILCVESSGRPTIIEVKLARNPEARRAIVSQVIAYAAFLQGFDIKALEQGPLRKALANASHDSILDAVTSQDQEGAVDTDSFSASMQGFLDHGNFRLVLVLDEVSAELTRMISYLDTITIQALTIDLITVKVYEVNGAQIALPQRVSPDVRPAAFSPVPIKNKSTGTVTDGSDVFRASIEDTTGKTRKVFEALIAASEQWATLPNVRLSTYDTTRPGEYTLRAKVMPYDRVLVLIGNDNGAPYISVWRSVFEKLAPNSIDCVEQTITPITFGQGNTVTNITPELIDAITNAYQEASDQ